MADAASLTDKATDAACSGDLGAALKLLNEALRRQPDYVPALINLGNVLADSGDADGASAAYERAIAAAPRSFEARANAGNFASEAGRVEEAIRHLRAVRTPEIDPAHQPPTLSLRLPPSPFLSP